MYKQLFRQKLKTILGIFLTALAVTGLCVGVGQSMAAAQTAEVLQNQFTTAAFPTNAFLWLDNPEKVGWWRSMDMAMPQEVVDWMENTARNHPDVVKTLSSPGLASAYIPDLKPDSYLRNTFYYYNGLEFRLNQRFHPLPLGAPYGCAMLEIQLEDHTGEEDRLGDTPYFDWENRDRWLDTSLCGWEHEMRKYHGVVLEGTITRVLGLSEDYPDPVGFEIRLALLLPPEALEELVPGERYLVYGMDYRDEDWLLRQFLKEDRGIDMPSSFQEEFLKPFSETELEQWKAGSQFNHYAVARYYGDQVFELYNTDIGSVRTASLTLKDASWLQGKPVEDAQPTIVHLEGTAEEFLNSPEGASWAKALEGISVNNHAFPILGVDRLSYIADFARGRARVVEGRDFTRQELDRGEKVCILSQTLAAANGISVGDTIDLQYYQYDWDSPYQYFLESGFGTTRPTAYFYTGRTPLEAESQTYTVVGLYRNGDPWGAEEEELYGFTTNTIFTPKKAVTGTMDYGNQGLFRTLVLENGKIPQFRELVTEAGYEDLFIYHDQGYEAVEPHLAHYQSAAGRALWVGVSLWAAIMLLTVLLFTLQQKKNLEIMRRLGTPPGACIRYIILSQGAILLPGTLLGLGVGIVLWSKVAEKLLASGSGTLTLEMNPASLAIPALIQLAAVLLGVLCLALRLTHPRRNRR